MRACEVFFVTPQIRTPDIFIEHAHIFEQQKRQWMTNITDLLFQRKSHLL